MYGCTKHNGVISSGSCGQCGLDYCDDCLVFPFGPSRPAMCVGCALVFAGVRRTGPKVKAPKQKVSWSERRRRRNRPTVPTVAMPEPSLADEFDLPAFETVQDVRHEVRLDEPLLPLESFETPAPVIAGPTMAEGLEALIAVPLPKRTVAIQP